MLPFPVDFNPDEYTDLFRIIGRIGLGSLKRGLARCRLQPQQMTSGSGWHGSSEVDEGGRWHRLFHVPAIHIDSQAHKHRRQVDKRNHTAPSMRGNSHRWPRIRSPPLRELSHEFLMRLYSLSDH
mmetsp:Transcript_28810/g.83177  ORF Transcript_28810/g.83177 Transcript_28810/m.83177 type:complete len:125 (+) Transcript_28810:811-1185(+)